MMTLPLPKFLSSLVHKVRGFLTPTHWLRHTSVDLFGGCSVLISSIFYKGDGETVVFLVDKNGVKWEGEYVEYYDSKQVTILRHSLLVNRVCDIIQWYKQEAEQSEMHQTVFQVIATHLASLPPVK